MDERDATTLLRAWREGSTEARDRLFAVLYDEIRGIAARQLSEEREGHTLQPTALVNEAWLKLVDTDVALNDRAHFMALTARVIRQVLVDHARRRDRDKRGGGRRPLYLEDVGEPEAPSGPAVTDLDRALVALAERDTRKARIVELHYFGGLTYDEIAAAEEVSAATVKRDLVFSRAWLRERLSI